MSADRPLPRRFSFLPAAVVAALALLSLVAPSAAARVEEAERPAPDTLTASGYDFWTEWPADVNAGSSRNNVVVQYVAGSPLVDGTLTVDFPRGDFPTPLQSLDVLTGDLEQEAGGVVVRPAGDFPPGPGDCTGNPGWQVEQTAEAQRVRVTGLDCQAGAQVKIRVFGILAPAAAGRYRLPVTVSDAAGFRRVGEPRLRVAPVPRVRLEVTTPARFTLGVPTSITVRALGPDGKVDTGFRGWIGLRSEQRHDCSFEGYENWPYEMTAKDAGVLGITVVVFTPMATRLYAYDVARQAVPGLSAPFGVEGHVDQLVCPKSFH